MPSVNPEERLYSKIEKRFKFSFPSEYREMRKLDWMTLVRPVNPETFKTPGRNYLWINDMEWYSLEEIAKFEFADYCAPYLPNLVPFAFTGGGDDWCWQTDHGMRVLYCAHDCYDGEIYAPDFRSALFPSFPDSVWERPCRCDSVAQSALGLQETLQEVAYEFDRAYALVKDVGYTHVMRFEKRKAVPVKIS